MSVMRIAATLALVLAAAALCLLTLPSAIAAVAEAQYEVSGLLAHYPAYGVVVGDAARGVLVAILVPAGLLAAAAAIGRPLMHRETLRHRVPQG